MSNPNDLHREIMLALGAGAARLFRNNVGMGWAGAPILRREDGAVVVHNARPLHAGLCDGSSDLIGWRATLITPGMVGQTVALFVAIEAKTGKARATPKQKQFIEVVTSMGGLAGIARNVEDARFILGMKHG
jgi:hypothetical protein